MGIQVEKFTTPKKVNIYFFLPEFSAMKTMTWQYHVNESAKGRYNMILGRDLLTYMGLDLKFYEDVIIGSDRTYEG